MSTQLYPQTETAFECELAAFGTAKSDYAGLTALRQQAGGVKGHPIPPRFLHHSDEQSVVGLTAVLQTIRDHQLEDEQFEEWGVLAASKFAGRRASAASFAKYQTGGPPTVSPHLIPQHSLHSLSGAISVALGMHGPNLGIGGGLDSFVEGLLVALAMFDDCPVPGMWFVLTEWEPELVVDEQGKVTSDDAVCHAAAFALVADRGCPRLRLTSPPTRQINRSGTQVQSAVTSVATLAAQLATASPGKLFAGHWNCTLPGGYGLQLIPAAAQQLTRAA